MAANHTTRPTPHAALMDRTYRHQKRIYDATRAWFLLGRDYLIAQLAPPPGATVLEIACGTGRNLDHVARRYPGCRLFGLDISEEMLQSARAKLGRRARLAYGDACDFDPQTLFEVVQFDRIILSYSLSMIPDWRAALEHGLGCLAPGGSLHLVDFGRQHRMPALARNALNLWLGRFHVTPRTDLDITLHGLATQHGLELRIRDLHGSYAQHAILTHAGEPAGSGGRGSALCQPDLVLGLTDTPDRGTKDPAFHLPR